MWAIRYPVRANEQNDEDQMSSVQKTPQKDVSQFDIIKGQRAARELHSLLYADCKKAANHFTAYLCPNGFQVDRDNQKKTLNFEGRVYPLIPVCIHAFEKVRHHVALNVPLRST